VYGRVCEIFARWRINRPNGTISVTGWAGQGIINTSHKVQKPIANEQFNCRHVRLSLKDLANFTTDAANAASSSVIARSCVILSVVLLRSVDLRSFFYARQHNML